MLLINPRAADPDPDTEPQISGVGPALFQGSGSTLLGDPEQSGSVAVFYKIWIRIHSRRLEDPDPESHL